MSISTPLDGKAPHSAEGFLYLPGFFSAEEGRKLIELVGTLRPLWEERYRDGQRARNPENPGKLTRPVYWLGGWQFACLGYYAEPDHLENRCLRSDPMPQVMQNILERTRVLLRERGEERLPNTCLINYYGRKLSDGPPVDLARLRMHRDSEPGPVVMFCLGQPGLLEFVEPNAPDSPKTAIWTRHRSISILSQGDHKDRLYHQIRQVRMGALPAMRCQLDNFELRRVSISFRYVPEQYIGEYEQLPRPLRTRIAEYVEELAASSTVFAQQWAHT